MSEEDAFELASEDEEVDDEIPEEEDATVVVVKKKPTTRTENYGEAVQFKASEVGTIIGTDDSYILQNPLSEEKNRVVWHTSKSQDEDQ